MWARRAGFWISWYSIISRYNTEYIWAQTNKLYTRGAASSLNWPHTSLHLSILFVHAQSCSALYPEVRPGGIVCQFSCVECYYGRTMELCTLCKSFIFLRDMQPVLASRWLIGPLTSTALWSQWDIVYDSMMSSFVEHGVHICGSGCTNGTPRWSQVQPLLYDFRSWESNFLWYVVAVTFFLPSTKFELLFLFLLTTVHVACCFQWCIKSTGYAL